MATAIAEPAATERPELIEYRRQDVAIAKMRDKYLPLKVAGLNDKAGLQIVHSARMVVKGFRLDIEEKRKELKSEALKYGQAVDAESNRLKLLIAPIEAHLQSEEDRIEDEKERVKQAALAVRSAALKVRMDKLIAVGMTDVHPSIVESLSDADFDTNLAKATAAHNERQRIAAEEAAAKLKAESEAAAERERQAAELKAERERLDKIRQEQLAEAARICDEQAKIDAEKQRLENEANERRRQEESERQLAEAREAARLQAERDIAARAEAEKLRAEAMEAARVKAAAEAPYREQLEAYAKALLAVPVPNGAADKKILAVVNSAVSKIREIAAGQL